MKDITEAQKALGTLMARWDYLAPPNAEELKAREWEALPQAEKDRQIKEANDERTWWGICQRCRSRVEAQGKNWPISCPFCGCAG